MRVAAMISGLPRFSKEFDDQLANLQGVSQIDWYCCLWKDVNDQYTSKGWDIADVNEYAAKLQSTFPPGHNLAALQLLPPPEYVDPQIPLNLTEWSQPPRIWIMYYGLLLVNNLRLAVEEKAGAKYDLVIRTRPDITLDTPVNLNEAYAYLIQNPKDIITPANGRTGLNEFPVNDQFAIGLPDTMTIYSDCFNQQYVYNNEGCVYHAESLLSRHLTKNGINTPMTNFGQHIRIYKNEDGTPDFGRWG